jgi:hypothetical protein
MAPSSQELEPPANPGRFNRPWAGYVERIFYNALAANLRRGQITVRINGTLPTLCEAERLVSKACHNGWICDQARMSGHLPFGEDWGDDRSHSRAS